jgi:hypothetical protein
VEPSYLCPRIEVEVATVKIKTVSYQVFNQDSGSFFKTTAEIESPVKPFKK